MNAGLKNIKLLIDNYSINIHSKGGCTGNFRDNFQQLTA